MSLQTYTIDKFLGLNFDQTNIGPEYSLDARNFEKATNGGLRMRYGVSQLSSVAMTAEPKYIMQRGDASTGKVLAIAPGEVAIYDPVTGAKTVPGGTPTWGANFVTRPAAFGAPANRYVYIATNLAGLVGVPLRKYEDTTAGVFTVSSPGTIGKPQFVAAWPGQNRLAQAGYFAAADTPSGANGTAATMFFSDELAPDTYTATNFVHLDPGDGERITGMVGYQNQLFVFKSTKMYVFYGVIPDDDGLPLPQYRTIILPDAIAQTNEPTAWDPVCVGPDGVYLVGTNGLWKTTGGSPTRVDVVVNSVFAGRGPSTTGFGMSIPGQIKIGFNGDRFWAIYIGRGLSGLNSSLFWDMANNYWARYDAGSMSTVPIYMAQQATSQGNPMYFFGIRSSGYQLYKETIGIFGDLAGSATNYTAQYSTGRTDLGQPSEKRIRFVDMWGQNTIGLNVSGTGRRTSANSTGTTTAVMDLSNRYDRINVPMVGREFTFGLSSSAVPGADAPFIDTIDIRYSPGSTT